MKCAPMGWLQGLVILPLVLACPRVPVGADGGSATSGDAGADGGAGRDGSVLWPAGQAGCQNPPMGEIVAWVGDGAAETLTTRVSGRVSALLPPGPANYYEQMVVNVADGGTVRINFDAPDLTHPDGTPYGGVGSLPNRLLAQARDFDFLVEQLMGFGTAYGLVVRDAQGLAYAGDTDFALFQTVLQTALPEFTITRLSNTCEPRVPVDSCIETARNDRLRFEHQGNALDLMAGESGVLDGFRITVLGAQAVTYSQTCADYTVPGVAFSIMRTDLEPHWVCEGGVGCAWL